MFGQRAISEKAEKVLESHTDYDVNRVEEISKAAFSLTELFIEV